MHRLVDGLRVLAFMNDADTSSHVQVFVQTYVFKSFGSIPRRRTPRLKSNIFKNIFAKHKQNFVPGAAKDAEKSTLSYVADSGIKQYRPIKQSFANMT